MDKDWIAEMEKALDELRTKVSSLEKAMTQIPAINMESDPSRPAGVVVEPAALVIP